MCNNYEEQLAALTAERDALQAWKDDQLSWARADAIKHHLRNAESLMPAGVCNLLEAALEQRRAGHREAWQLLQRTEAENATLRDRVARLEGALEKIAQMSCTIGYDSGHAGIYEIARAALAASPAQEPPSPSKSLNVFNE